MFSPVETFHTGLGKPEEMIISRQRVMVRQQILYTSVGLHGNMACL